MIIQKLKAETESEKKEMSTSSTQRERKSRFKSKRFKPKINLTKTNKTNKSKSNKTNKTKTSSKPSKPKKLEDEFMDMKHFLTSCKVNAEKYLPVFNEHEVTLASLLLMKEEDLEKIQILLGPRKQILNALVPYRLTI